MMPERWLAQAKFNHAKHATISCAQCHDAVHSKDTADIILPAKETCMACHSPRGGVADSCAECHTYHKPQVAAH
jgi:Zn-finger protein